MYEIGTLAVLVTAPLLARIVKSDNESYESSLAYVRNYGMSRPEDADEVTGANVYRVMAWIPLVFVFLAVYGLTAFARTASSPTVRGLLEGAMRVEAVILTTVIGLLFLSVWRLILARLLAGALRVRLDDSREPRPGFVGWLTVPNNVDLLTALLFAACMAPPLFP